ncbi:MAG: tRNA (adenosine(37)-N6)-threonylcarbamoyltransferase complex dimerization subunit type 1 TsaB [Polyangia bacterium]
MLVLAFDTSTRLGSVGCLSAPEDGRERYAELTAPADPGHAETLVPRLESILAAGGFGFDQVDLVAFGRGPGTFTGLRIGASTAKGLSRGLGIPLVGVSSLEALAVSSGREGLVATLTDARRGEVYAALWRVMRRGGRAVAEPLVEERVLEPGAARSMLEAAAGGKPLLLVGDALRRYGEQLGDCGTPSEPPTVAPRAICVADLGAARFAERGGDDPAAVEPVYLRAPDARLPARRLR